MVRRPWQDPGEMVEVRTCGGGGHEKVLRPVEEETSSGLAVREREVSRLVCRAGLMLEGEAIC